TFTLQNGGRVVQTDSLATTVGQGLGFSWSPARGLVAPGHAVDFALNTPADAARQLKTTLSVTTDVDPALMRAGTDANFLRIQLTGSRPAELAATVNAIADRVVVVAADLKRIKLVELGRILDEQRQHALRGLRDAEAAQRDFRIRSAGVLRQGAPPVSATLRGGGDPVFERSFDTKLALDSVQRDRQALQRALAQTGDSGPPIEALQAIGAVQKSAELSLALEEARLQRDVAIAEQLFTTVQQSYNQTQLAAVSTLPDVRILDRATAPDRPDRDLTPLLVCASFVVSLGLAVFGVVMLD